MRSKLCGLGALLAVSVFLFSAAEARAGGRTVRPSSQTEILQIISTINGRHPHVVEDQLTYSQDPVKVLEMAWAIMPRIR
jgi:hypothetical protein